MISNKRSLIVNIFLALLIIILSTAYVYAQVQPTAPDTIIDLGNQSPEPSSGTAMDTAGGTITHLQINATTQNLHWKAYVGNVSGRLALQDASGNSVFDWNVTSTEGEIYATRKSDVVDWNNLQCADAAEIKAEETAVNMSTTAPDSIINTFTQQSHARFYAGMTEIAENTCNSTNLYVNSEASSDFAEVLLHDGSDVVYAGLIEDSVIGFDGTEYDFQMILPDSGLEGSQTPETYYFYVELI